MLPLIRIKYTETYPGGKIKYHKLVSRKEWIRDSNYKVYDNILAKEPSPYKGWGNLLGVVTVPAYYIGLFAYRILKIKETKKTTIATLIFASIFDGVVGYFISVLLNKL